MPLHNLEFHQTGAVSRLMLDYLSEAPQLEPFVRDFPSAKASLEQSKLKAKQTTNRDLLVNSLEQQYNNSIPDWATQFPKTKASVSALKKDHVFTVCTGHQLCLATGPLYFIYKIAGIISLAKDLSLQHKEIDVIPVFWLASEDHDWEEANQFFFSGKKHSIEEEWTTAVGFKSTASAKAKIDQLKKEYAHLEELNEILELVSSAYADTKNFADATRLLVHKLFADTNLVVLDGDDKALKQSFSPVMEEELFGKSIQEKIDEQSEVLSTAYFAQINAREINLFYLDKDIRARIARSPDGYEVQDSQMVFSENQLRKLLQDFPERFSPNVALRPLYQEFVLPNLAYVGGGGEIAYWLQLKLAFEQHNIQFPLVMLRNSFAFLSAKAYRKMEKYKLDFEDLFKEETVWLRENHFQDSEWQALLEKTSKDLEDIAKVFEEKLESYDQTLVPSVKAERARQENGLKRLEKKIVRAIKRKEHEALDALRYINSELYPQGVLQERKLNLLSLIQELGPEAITEITESMNPLKKRFIIFEPQEKKALG